MGKSTEQEATGIIVRREDGSLLYTLAVPDHDFSLMSVVSRILKDEGIEEIMYNGPDQPIRVFHHSYGMCETDFKVPLEQVEGFLQKAMNYNNKILNGANPILDGALPDGSRINIVVPPASLSVSITVRKFRHTTLSVLDLIRDRALPSDVAAFLWTCISNRANPKNLLFVGGTASGKTTLLNAFSMFIREEERVVVIEDTPELQLKQPNIVRLVSNPEKGIDMDALLKNSLRMRPDRIIVGEVRGSEASTLFTAMNTGNDGCLGTLHANSAKESVSRITSPPMSVQLNLLGALDLIVVLKKLPNAIRRIQEISEISGHDQDGVRFNRLYEWDQKRNQCVETGIPSRLKGIMAEEAGVAITEINSLILKRKEIIEELLARNASQTDLLSAVNKEDEFWASINKTSG
jgi:flagellar protein FlaI